ncbi:histidine-containing phosphotransfer protein 1-like [Nymphaea colorata]|nr:histidine-containing phosphotransfer protein 1-like [Nymphaea colorata]
MDAIVLKEQRLAFLNSLFCEGYLDEQFKQVQMLQDANTPGFMADLITLYCQDSERILAEISQALNEKRPDFRKVDASVHQLKGSSASVGAHQVKLACIELRSHCEQANKDGCVKALNVVKQQFYILRNKLETLMQLEQKIQVLAGSHI